MFGARGIARLVPPNRFKKRPVWPNSVKSVKRVRFEMLERNRVQQKSPCQTPPQPTPTPIFTIIF